MKNIPHNSKLNFIDGFFGTRDAWNNLFFNCNKLKKLLLGSLDLDGIMNLELPELEVLQLRYVDTVISNISR